MSQRDSEEQVAQEGLLEKMKTEDAYSSFFSQDFDVARYANAAVVGGHLAATLHKISQGIALLEQELRSQVAANLDDLADHALETHKLRDVLSSVTSRVAHLQTHTHTLLEQLEKPYKTMLFRMQQLERLQHACDLLRRTHRHYQLVTRLRSQLKSGTRELPKAAATLRELHEVTSELDLSGIEAVDSERAFVQQAQEGVTKQAKNLLTQGVEGTNQGVTATALAALNNLGLLKDEVTALVTNKLRAISKRLNQLFSQTSASDPTTQHASGHHAAFWTSMESVFNSMASNCGHMHTLSRVMQRKADTSTHVSYADIVQIDTGDIASMFWNQLCEMLKSSLEKAAKVPTLPFRAIEAEYPRLIRLTTELWRRTVQQHGADMPKHQRQAQQRLLRESVAIFEPIYLSACVSRMFDRVHLVFPAGGKVPPTHADVEDIVKAMKKELDAVASDERLLASVLKNIAKTVSLYNVKSEELQSNDEVTYEIVRPCSEGMQRNIALVNRAYQLAQGVTDLVVPFEQLMGKWGGSQPGSSSPTRDLAAQIRRAVASATAQADEILDRLFQSITLHLEAHLDGMLSVDYAAAASAAGPDQVPDSECSDYVTAFQDAVSAVQSDILALFSSKDLLTMHTRSLMNRLLHCVVCRACVCADELGEGGRLRLTADLAQIEMGIAQLEHSSQQPISGCGSSYRAFRALRPLLFLDANDVATAPSVGDSIPPGLVSHHMFSRIGSAITPPWKLHGHVSRLQYVRWLESADDAERSGVAAEALQKYVRDTEGRGERQYHPLFPFLQILVRKRGKSQTRSRIREGDETSDDA